MKQEYYFLNREVFLHEGKNTFAVYNLVNEEMIALSKDTGLVLTQAENGNSLDMISSELKISKDKVVNILNDVKKKGLGEYYTNRVYIEKYKVGIPDAYRLHSQPVFNFCFIEIPGECSLDCGLCEYPIYMPCSTCRKVKGSVDNLTIELFIKRMIQTNCMNLVFHGGDPLMNPELLFNSIAYARDNGYQGTINVISNGSLIDKRTINLFVKSKVRPIIPVFFTRHVKQESYLPRVLNLFNEHNVPFIITMATVEDEKDGMDTLRELVQSTKPEGLLQVAIYNRQRLSGKNSYRQLISIPRKINAKTYYQMQSHSPCLYGTVALSVKGDILPCPHLKKEKLSNIKEPYWLERIFETNAINDYWDLSLSSIDNCRDCAFRYGCLDCRAFEVEIKGDLFGKQTCNYPEKTGIGMNLG